MRFARRHAEALPLDKIPIADQWKKYDEENKSSYTIEYGINLKRLGFSNPPIPSGCGDILDSPRGLDRELFNCKDRRAVYRFARGFYKPHPQALIANRLWADKTLLLSMFRRKDLPIIRLVRIGDFIQCHNEIERVLHRYLMGGSMPAIFITKQWREE